MPVTMKRDAALLTIAVLAGGCSSQGEIAHGASTPPVDASRADVSTDGSQSIDGTLPVDANDAESPAVPADASDAGASDAQDATDATDVSDAGPLPDAANLT